MDADRELAHDKIELLRKEMASVIVGQKKFIDRLLIALLSDGHLLIEGVPGIAKTLAVTTLSKCLQLDYKRIQFTPDLLPSDLTGISMYRAKEEVFTVEKGPVFTNVLLADEINRAPPKVQSALLEVMQERQVTIAGETMRTMDPFFVLATQNPIEHEGTYPLPEAQTDRFLMKVLMGYPSKEEEREVVQRICAATAGRTPNPVITLEELASMRSLVKEIYIDEKIIRYIVDLVAATRCTQNADIAGMIEYGASPRASIGLAVASKAHAFLNKRSYVTPYDVKEVGCDVLRHRLVLSYEAEAQERSADSIIAKIFDMVEVP